MDLISTLLLLCIFCNEKKTSKQYVICLFNITTLYIVLSFES